MKLERKLAMRMCRSAYTNDAIRYERGTAEGATTALALLRWSLRSDCHKRKRRSVVRTGAACSGVGLVGATGLEPVTPTV